MMKFKLWISVIPFMFACGYLADGDGYVQSMAPIEEDFVKCFRDYPSKDSKINIRNITFDKFKEDYKHLSPIIIDLAKKFILAKTNNRAAAINSSLINKNAANVTPQGNGNSNQGNGSVDELAARIFDFLIKLYLAGSDNEGVLYHNSCHGLYVAFITDRFLTECRANKDKCTQDSQNSKEITISDIDHAAIVFAALFHDAGHPGVGNNLYKLSKTERDNLKAHIISRLKILFPNQYNDNITSLEGNINNLYDDSRFVLENVHSELALFAYDILIGNEIQNENSTSNPKDIIKEVIYNTLMNKDSDKTEDELKKLAEQPKSQVQTNILYYLAHVADLSLLSSYNPKLLIQGTATVFKEFVDEAKAINTCKDREYFGNKIPGDDISNYLKSEKLPQRRDWLLSFFLACADNVNNIYMGQISFIDFVIKPSLTKVSTLKVDIYTYISNNLENNKKFYTDIGNYKEGYVFTDARLNDRLYRNEDLKLIEHSYEDFTAACPNRNVSKDNYIPIKLPAMTSLRII